MRKAGSILLCILCMVGTAQPESSESKTIGVYGSLGKLMYGIVPFLGPVGRASLFDRVDVEGEFLVGFEMECIAKTSLMVPLVRPKKDFCLGPGVLWGMAGNLLGKGGWEDRFVGLCVGGKWTAIRFLSLPVLIAVDVSCPTVSYWARLYNDESSTYEVRDSSEMCFIPMIELGLLVGFEL